MSQNEIYIILKSKRLSNIDTWYSQSMISKMILEGHITMTTIGSPDKASVSKELKRLYDWGILERCYIKGTFYYRLKKKMLEGG